MNWSVSLIAVKLPSQAHNNQELLLKDAISERDGFRSQLCILDQRLKSNVEEHAKVLAGLEAEHAKVEFPTE